MDYSEAMTYIHGANKFGSKLGLENIRELTARMGDPQKRLNIVHVAGTNGKGSVVALLSGVLAAAGYKTGAFISPYVGRFNERIKINGRDISDEDVADLAGVVKDHAERMAAEVGNHPTEFEIVTAMALAHYERQHCDVVVLEVGLGGRLDATNVVECPLLAIITAIDFDHVRILGDTLGAIAYEKAGIIKAGGDVLTFGQAPEAAAVIEAVCADRGAALHRAAFADITPECFDLDGQRFNAAGWGPLHIRLLGAHQLKNACLALKAVEILREKGLSISDGAVKNGLANARWPGRFEIASRSPLVVIDGAHNAQSARVLSENLAAYFPGKKFVFVAGVLADKDYEAMMSRAIPLASAFFTVTPDSPRALPASELADCVRALAAGAPGLTVSAFGRIQKAVAEAVSMGGPVCVFGSLYILGQIRRYFGLN